jgi:hypothetical protein
MPRRILPAVRPVGALLGLFLLAACSDESGPSANADASAPAPATPAIVTEQAETQAEELPNGDAYYDTLEQRFGEDYAACGESRRSLPEGCDGVGDPADPGGGDAHVLLMLDASGSMAGRVGGERKLDVAQDALIDFVGRLPESARVGLRVYGHTGDNSEAGKSASCTGSSLLHPFATLDRARFASDVHSFEPVGWTPIAASLAAAAQDLGDAGATRGLVYLVSDGIETCDADPVEAARKLRESGMDVVVNVIGFDVGSADAEQLREVAAAGGGEYLSAANRADLFRIFSERVGEAHRRFHCVVAEQYGAFNETVSAQYGRFNCLVERATREYIAVVEASAADHVAGRIDSDTRGHARGRAQAKRDGVIGPARQERDSVTREARALRDGETSRERDARDRRVDEARSARDEGAR